MNEKLQTFVKTFQKNPQRNMTGSFFNSEAKILLVINLKYNQETQKDYCL